MVHDPAAFERTRRAAREALLNARNDRGHWDGRLSSSALSTATAVFALHLAMHPSNSKTPRAAGLPFADRCKDVRDRGIAWLRDHQNPDGGWGDTTLSFSNISTTALCWAALGAQGCEVETDPTMRAIARAQDWLVPHSGGVDPAHLSAAIIARYGKDKTFSVPILTMCALAGRLGAGRDAWRVVPQLPFELAAFPQRLFKWLRLPVVSYALPALIAIGLVRHRNRPPRINLAARAVRALARRRALRLLARIQPASGGFLEATPLTSFVLMSLIGAGESADHPIVRRGLEFLINSARPDGSWPIDTNLATWVTTLSINAIAGDSTFLEWMAEEERRRVRDWLLRQQYRCEHPYTLASPGGWAWTDLTGGVPDADDTPGALLALHHLRARTASEVGTDVGSDVGSGVPYAGSALADVEVRKRSSKTNTITGSREGLGAANASRPSDASAKADPTGPTEPTESSESIRTAAAIGVRWLMDLQNRDGGIPTFCRGWGKLPFDRSSADLTAHALRAWSAWSDQLSATTRTRLAVDAIPRAVAFLCKSQKRDGSWTPLWFGNQHLPDDENPTYGTTRVLRAAPALWALGARSASWGLAWERAVGAGVGWLLNTQHADGGWGGGSGDSPASIEETALAVEALACLRPYLGRFQDHVHLDSTRVANRSFNVVLSDALDAGVAWIIEHTHHGTRFDPSPIGFYFAKLWYFEELYPLIFTVAALEAVSATSTP